MKQITEKTLVPISLVIAIASAVWWAAGIEKRVEANQKEMDRLGRVEQKIEAIALDVAVIKNTLKRR